MKKSGIILKINFLEKVMQLFIIVIFFSSCSTNQISNDWDINNLKGRVKSLNESSYVANESYGEIYKGEKKWSYDENYYNGQMIKLLGSSIFNIGYYEDKFLMSFLWNSKSIEFDINGRIIKAISYDSRNKIDELWLYEYENNILKCIKISNEYDHLEKRLDFVTDETNRIIQVNLYNRNEQIEGKWSFEYKNNIPISQKTYDSDGSITYTRYYEYNEDLNLIRINSDYYGEIKKEWEFEYDNDKNIINFTMYSLYYENKIEFQVTFEYLDQNVISEKIYASYNESNMFLKYEYKFDDNNNWINKIIYQDGTPKYIIEREYEYY